jgi:hypothetical protein
MTFRGCRVAQFLLLLLVTLPAAAYRREYVVTLDGARKAGSDVCFYHGASETALSLFFMPGQTVCLPADAVLDLPPGTFNFFARHHDGYVSVLRDYTIYKGADIPERGYQQLEIPLVPAALIDVAAPTKALAPNEFIGVWVAPTPSSIGSFIRVVTGETTMWVPADTPVVPLLIRAGVPVSVGPVMSLERGTRATLPEFARRTDGLADVVTWIELDNAAARAARGMLPPPDVLLIAAGKAMKPTFTLFHPTSKTLLIFRDVPPGNAELRLSGTVWKRVSRNVTIDSPLTIVREALPVVAAGSVLVQWPSDDDATSTTTCGTHAATDAPRIAVGVLQCDANQRCSMVAERAAPFSTTQSLTVEGLAPASYVVAVRLPGGDVQRHAVDVVAGQQSSVSVAVSTFKFFGTVKLNGEPIRARLVFATGEAVSDDLGRYVASLSGPPLTNRVHVQVCGSSQTLRHFPKDAILPNSPYDIDLRPRRFSVRVLSNGRPVADAAVSLCIMKPAAGGNLASCYDVVSAGATDANGVVTAEVPGGYSLNACATHKDFPKKCSEPAESVTATEMTLTMDQPGLRGRVDGHAGRGTLTFVSPSGQTVEEVDIASDGTFVTRLPHGSPEHYVYASTTRPLFVAPMPALSAGELVVNLPAGVGTPSFTVSVPNMTAKSGFVGVWIGGRYVPILAMDFHMTARGSDSVLQQGKSVTFRDIAATGPITVAFAVPPDVPSSQFVDVFTLPQYAGVERKLVSSAAVELSQ